MTEAFGWYEEQRSGLGEEFLMAIREALATIAESPTMFHAMHRDKRRATTKRFPYSIIYKAEQDRIVVIAIFHGRRNPDHWRRR